jgi:hypothetical protein
MSSRSARGLARILRRRVRARLGGGLLLLRLLLENRQFLLCRQPLAAQPGELSSMNSHGQLLFHKGYTPVWPSTHLIYVN